MLPPPEYRAEQGNGRSSRNPLRDFMLKYPDSDSKGPPCSLEPGYDGRPSPDFPALPSSPFRDLNPFSKVKRIFPFLYEDFVTVVILNTIDIYNVSISYVQSLMIFGRRGHRKLQRKSEKKTEVGDLNSLLKERIL